jgi:transposase-like protein
MVRSSSFSASKETECPRCGSLYEVRMVRLPEKNHYSYDCVVCDYRLAVWNDMKFPSYMLLKREPWPKPKKV